MYGLLLKTFVRERLSLRRLFGQKIARSKIQSVLMVGVLIYAFGVTAFSNIILQYEIAQTLVVIDGLSQMLYQVVASLSSLGFLFGFFQAQGYLFQYKDFDLLGPLPISQKTIVAAKLSMMLVFVYLFSFIVVLPTFSVWWYVSEASILQVFFFVPMAMVAPIPLMLLGSLVSFIFRTLTQRWIHANVLQTIFSLMFIISFTAVNFLSNEILPSSWLSIVEPLDLIGDWFVNGVHDLNIGSVIWFIGLHLIILVTFINVMSGPLLKINQQRTNLNYKRQDKTPTHSQSVIRHLIQKEWRRFIGTSVYFINTSFGIFMLMILSIVSLFIPSTILEVRQTIVAMGFEPLWLMVAIIGFAVSTVYTPAVSLSLEGKNINLLKSLPIQAWTIIQAKIFFNLLITLPVIVVASFVGSILFQIELLTMILFILMMLLFAILLSGFFMYLNLWFPRFDFHQEVEVVKQSLASLVAVFGGFSMLGVLLWLAFVPLFMFDLHLRLMLLSLIELSGIVFGGWLLKRNSESYFQKLIV
ncbi:MAG: hypothetical protein RIS53_484 [Bacillota bacterium]|jgi:ABC-2 type transport system permease protein